MIDSKDDKTYIQSQAFLLKLLPLKYPTVSYFISSKSVAFILH